MLSSRALDTSTQLDQRWRFPPTPSRYHPQDNPEGTVVFNTAENALIFEDVAEFIKTKVHFTGDILTYGYSTAGGKRLPKAMAAHLNEFFSPHQPLTGDDIIFTAGASSLHSALSFSVGDPGDGILLSRPCYGRFEIDFSFEAGLRPVWVDTEAETCFDPDVVEAFEEALAKSHAAGVTIKAVMIVNPHNPLGKCYPKETLIALMKFCQRHRIHLISDEIYGLSVFDSIEPGAVPFTSVLSIDSGSLIDPELLHVIYGMAKAYGSPGLRLGALITRSKPMLKALRSIVRFHNTSGISIAVATTMLEDREWCRAFIPTMRRRLAVAHKVATDGLREIGVEYMLGSNAALYVWIDLSPYLPPESLGLSHEEREMALGDKILAGGVLLQPLEEHALRPGWFRLVYTDKREIIQEGLRRLGNMIREITW